MTFGASQWFWVFAGFPVLIALFFANEHRRAQLLGKLVAARLAPRLAGTVSVAKRRLRFLLVLLGLAVLIAALAQPRYGVTFEHSKRKGRDVLIAIDTSRSMLANDLAPNRLTRAKLAAQDLLTELKGDRVGVVAFAGTAFLQAPLTIDYGAVLNAINELDTEIIPEGGSNIAEMIRASREAFGKSESDNRALIVFSDGEELDTDGIKAAADLNGQVRIFSVGVGSPEGALVPLPSGGKSAEFVKDEKGQIVKSRLDEERLRKIAESTGGFYLRLQSGRPEMKQIVADGLGKMSEQDIDARLSRHPIERYEWPLAAGLVVLAASMLIGERRAGKALRGAAAMLMLAHLPGSAFAKNSGVEAYERQDYPGALREFSDQLKLQPKSPELQFNRGSAAYKAGNLEEALAAFSQAVTADDPKLRTRAAYNIGNTLFQRGAAQSQQAAKIQEWKNALQHYDEALKIDPKNEDAIYNRDLIRKLLKELEKEPPKPEEQKKEEQQKKEPQQQQKQDQQKGNDQQKKQDQQQGGDQQDEQKQDGGGQDQPPPPKDGSKGNEQDKNQPSAEAKDGQEPEEGKDGDKPQEQGAKDQDGAGDKQQQQPKPQSGGEGQRDKREKGESAEKPEPAPQQPGEKKEGELRSASGENGEQPADPQAEAAADAEAAAEGKMTEQQAKALLNSLKNEDQKVQLVDPEKRRAKTRTLRNW